MAASMSMRIAISISIFVSIVTNVECLIAFINHVRELEETGHVIDLSYIFKPSTYAIDVLCRPHFAMLYLKISCPAFDEPSEDIFQENSECLSTNDHWYGGCPQIIRRIPWKITEHLNNFTCACWVQQHDGLECAKEEASIQVANHECRTNKNAVILRKINQEKSIHLFCCITGDPTPDITWFKDDIPLIKNENTTINNVRYRQKKSGLVVSRSDVRASGSYRCFAKNIAGHDNGRLIQVQLQEGGQTNAMNGSNLTHQDNTSNLTGSTPTNVIAGSNLFHQDNADNLKGARFIVKPNRTENDKEEDLNKRDKKSGVNGKFIGIVSSLLLIFMISVGLVKMCMRRNQNPESYHRTLDMVFSCGNRLLVSRRRKKCSKSVVNFPIDDNLIVCDDDDVFLHSPHNDQFACESFLPSLSYSTEQSTHGPNFAHNACKSVPQDVLSDPSIFTVLPSKCLEQNPTSSFSQFKHSCRCSALLNRDFAPVNTFSPIRSEDQLQVNTADDDIKASTSPERSARIPSPDLSTNSDTSALFNSLMTIPPNADGRYFERRLIDHNGGELILEGTGVSLVIPEGALDVGRTEAIYLALIGNPEYLPKQLDDDETLLSHVVMCGPHGLHFKKHVMLVLPRCGSANDNMEKKFRVLCSNTAPEFEADWEEIFSPCQEQIEDVFCNKRKRHFSIFLLHFSWYTIVGEGEARKFSVEAYHTSFHQEGEIFKVRLHFMPILPNSSVVEEKVRNTEKRLQGTLSDSGKVKIFRRNGGDINVEAIKISEGWTLDNETVQPVGYTLLFHCNEESPNRTFQFKHVERRPREISIKFRVIQEQCKFDTPEDINLSLNFEAEIKRSQLTNNYIRNRNASLDSSGYVASGESTTVSFISRSLRKSLRELLDITIIGKENCYDLAHRMGHDRQFIRWLEDYASKVSSPTEKLLMEWEQTVEMSPEDSLRYLEQTLWKMKRDDAAMKVQEYLAIYSDGARRETTV